MYPLFVIVKPKKQKRSGEPAPKSLLAGERFAQLNGNKNLLGSPYQFAKHGQNGMNFSELLPHLAGMADQLTMVRSLTTDSVNHDPAMTQLNTGAITSGRPGFGSWVVYGLGSACDDLPAYVVCHSGKGQSIGAHNWSSGFLPTIYQGVQFRGQGDPVLYLRDPEWMKRESRRRSLDALRKLNDQHTHVRVTNLVFPYAFVIPMSAEMTITQWHVPIDDTSCYWYAIFTSFGAPVDHAAMREQRLKLYELPDYRPRVGRHNGWGHNVQEQKNQTFTGMGFDINVHDQWAIESQGRIQDRTREHLGTTDKAIVAYRRMLLSAIGQVANGEKPPMWLDPARAAAIRGPIAIDGMGPTEGWQSYWKDVDARRRSGSSWAANTAPPLVA